MNELWIFQTGHGKGLARAELEAVYGPSKIEVVDEVEDGWVLKGEIDGSQKALKQLGGTVRITKVLEKTSANIPINFASWVKAAVDEEGKNTSGKLRYGLSMHPKSDYVLKKVLSESKRLLKSTGLSCRFVNKNFQNLSSAQAWHEKLTGPGALELHLFKSSSKWYLSKTSAIQDLEWYSHRDMDRPERDPKAGMFPPKLAQILINLAQAKKTVYDPFCGCGTLLQEAWLKGHEIQGSDIDPKMVNATQENLKWLKGEAAYLGFHLETNPHIFQKDATQLGVEDLPKGDFTIVTETWLGPPVVKALHPKEIENIHQQVLALYKNFFSNLKRMITSDICILFTAPYHRVGKERHFIKELPALLQQSAEIEKLSKETRGSLLYERKDQWVGREIWKIHLRAT